MENTSAGRTTGAGQTRPVAAYAFGTTLALPFAQAIARVTEALAGEGFGVLTTIDVRSTLKAKLDLDFEPFTILGACNPQLAHRALELDRDLGLLLPCNVVVRQQQADTHGTSQTRVEIADPVALLGIVGNPAIEEVALEARSRLKRVLAAL